MYIRKHLFYHYWGPKKGQLVEQEVVLSFLLGFLGQKDSLDVGENTSLGNGDSSQEFVELLVVTDGQLKMTRDDPGLLVVTGSVTSQLENLSSEILHDSSQVHGGTSTNTGSVVSLAEQTMDTTNWELKSGPARPRLGLSLHLSSLTTSRHVDVFCCTVRYELRLNVAPTYIYTTAQMLC